MKIKNINKATKKLVDINDSIIQESIKKNNDILFIKHLQIKHNLQEL